MKPKLLSFKFGDVVTNVWSKEKLDSNKKYRFIVFCHGLPGHPYQRNPAKMEKLMENGFVLVYPDYIGTWASHGTMSWEKCIDTILQTIDFVKNGKGNELWNNSEVTWNVKDVTLIGTSFGGSVALVAGAKSDVSKIISIAAPIDYKNHSKIDGENECIDKLYDIVMRGWKNLWRIPTRKEWDKIVTGKADINAVDYIEQLKNKHVFFIHGAKDDIVSSTRSKELYEKINTNKGNHKLLILENEDHSISQEKIVSEILKWL